MWSSPVCLWVRNTALRPTSPSQPSPWLLHQNQPLSVSKRSSNQVRRTLKMNYSPLLKLVVARLCRDLWQLNNSLVTLKKINAASIFLTLETVTRPVTCPAFISYKVNNIAQVQLGCQEPSRKLPESLISTVVFEGPESKLISEVT